MGKVETEHAEKVAKDNDKDTLPRSQLANGPVADRSCTDILCCLIFVAFAVVLVGVSGYGFANGDPMLLLTTWDADGNGCGYSPATKDYPFLYFPAIDYNAAASASSSGSSSDIMKSL